MGEDIEKIKNFLDTEELETEVTSNDDDHLITGGALLFICDDTYFLIHSKDDHIKMRLK